jgi:hypothetical protein
MVVVWEMALPVKTKANKQENILLSGIRISDLQL